MNLTTMGHIPGTNWKRFKGKYVAAVAVLTLAAGAVLAVAPIGSTSQPQAPNRPSSIPAVTSAGEVPHQYFYIVDSEDTQALLQDDVTKVVVAGSEAARALLGEGAREMMAAGVPFTIIDTTLLRPSSAAQRQASDADIAASVLSTELANFGQ